MSPRARIIVSYTRHTGEIVADAMDFDVDLWGAQTIYT